MRLKITLLAALIFIVNTLYAQDTIKPFSFPHKTGDMWEYFYFEGGPYGSPLDTLQNFTIFDSTDSQGIIHITQYGRAVNPIKPSGFFDTTKYIIDTIGNLVYKLEYAGSKSEYDSLLIYKLDAVQDEVWVVFDNKSGVSYDIAKVRDKWEETIFGVETTFMEINYYSTYDITDTLAWLHMSNRIIADNFGMIHIGGGDFFADYDLIGAVIDGKLYGDTTLVSIKNKFSNIPVKIELYQNYPNPFNPLTTISFQLMSLENILLIIYDVLGNEVIKLIDNQEFQAGEYNVIWKGLNKYGNKAASGIYFYRLITENQVLTRSMILLK